jgi:hypothetical protein
VENRFQKSGFSNSTCTATARAPRAAEEEEEGEEESGGGGGGGGGDGQVVHSDLESAMFAKHAGVAYGATDVQAAVVEGDDADDNPFK